MSTPKTENVQPTTIHLSEEKLSLSNIPILKPLKKPYISQNELHTGVKDELIEPGVEIDEDDLLPPVPIIQHSYDITVEDNFQNLGKSIIHIWCLDRNSDPSLLRVEFPAFCYIELPEFVSGTPVQWDNASAFRVVKYLKFVLKESDHSPSKWALSFKYTIYYYDRQRKPMILLSFNTIEAMEHCKKLIKEPRNIKGIGTCKFNMWEDKISIIRKMFTLRKCRYAQWFEIKGSEVPLGSEHRITSPGTKDKPIKEYICNWNTLVPIKAEDSKDWMTFPRIFAIDIETYTDNHHAMPNKFDVKHVAYQISCVMQKIGDISTREKVLITLGGCDDIPGSKVVRCKTEYAMVEAMADLIREYDPEIVSGYNIFAYDYDYLDVRIKTKMLDWPRSMGRIMGKETEMKSKSWSSGAYGHNSINNLQMDGRINIDMLPIVRRDYKLDKYDLNFVSNHFIGRGKHDVKPVEMFEIYELLEDAQKAYDEEKTPETEEKLAYATSKMGKVGAYCLEDSALVIDLFDVLNVWIGLVELSSIVGVTIVELFTRGQQVRCLSQIYDSSSRLNYVINIRITMKMFYSGGFVYEPKPGLYDNIICVDFASLYPSIMMAYNICYTTFVRKEQDKLIPDSMCNVNEFSQEEPANGKSTKRSNDDEQDEGKLDGVEYSDSDDDDEDSKTMVTRNYKFKFVKKEERDGILPQLVRSLVGERNAVKGVIKTLYIPHKIYVECEKRLRANNSNEEAIESIKKTINLIESKDKTNIEDKQYIKMLNECIGKIKESNSKDEMLIICEKKIKSLGLQMTVYDKRQLALKVSSNSMYGFLGAQDRGLLPLIEAAMAVTAWGRRLIMKVNSHIEEKHGGTIVYGDTDSSMADMGIKDPKDANRVGLMLTDEISGTEDEVLPDGTIKPGIVGLFPKPLRVEFEKAMRLLCIRKKKYAYYMIGKNGKYICDKDTGLPIIHKKGISIARRDNCKAFRETYTNLLRGVLDGSPMIEGFRNLVSDILSLLNYEILPKGNLTIIRGIGSTYKSNTYFMKVFSDELRRMGRPANPGDRLEYLIVKTKDELNGEDVPLGKKMRAIDMWDETQEIFKNGPPKLGSTNINFSYVYEKEDIDVIYYLEHVYMNAIDQLFSIGYMNELLPIKGNLGYQPQHSRRKFGSIEFPLQMISKMITDVLLSYKHLSNTEKEKIKHITNDIKTLPSWLESKITAV